MRNVEVSTITAILDTSLAVIFTWVAYKTGQILWKYTPYSYPNARIRAMEARLFTEQKFNELAESKTLNNFIMNLEDTDYKPYLTSLPALNSESIDRALDKALTDTYGLFFKILPKRTREFFKLLLEEWDVRNITSSVKAKLRGEVARDYINEIGTMVEKVKAIADAKSFEEILVILEGTEYEEAYQKLLLKEITPEEFETELYKNHYLKLSKYAATRKDEEKTILQEFVSLKIDKINLSTILRGKAHGLGADKLRDSLILGGKIKRKTLEALANMEDVEMVLAELDSTEYSGIIREHREEILEDISAFERAFDRYILQRMAELTRFYPLSIAVPLSYILQKESEIRKLKAIAKLIEDGVKPEIIKKVVGELP